MVLDQSDFEVRAEAAAREAARELADQTQEKDDQLIAEGVVRFIEHMRAAGMPGSTTLTLKAQLYTRKPAAWWRSMNPPRRLSHSASIVIESDVWVLNEWKGDDDSPTTFDLIGSSGRVYTGARGSSSAGFLYYAEREVAWPGGRGSPELEFIRDAWRTGPYEVFTDSSNPNLIIMKFRTPSLRELRSLSVLLFEHGLEGLSGSPSETP